MRAPPSSSPLLAARPLEALLLLLVCCSLPTLGFLLQSGSVPLASRTAAARRQGGMQMMAKNVRFGDKGLDKLVEGINVVGDAVKVRTCRVSCRVCVI